MAASTAVTSEDVPRDAPRAERSAQIASLTGLRGVSALMVLLIHVSGRSDYVWLGVPGYGPVSLFVLSGFLLYRPWARYTLGQGDRPSMGQFAWRRAWRIFPAYLVVLAVVVIVDPASRPADPGGWLRAVTLTWIYEVEPLREAMLHTWSLATEISWYAALPLMAGATALLARRMPPARAFWFSATAISLAFPVSAVWRSWVEADGRGGTLTYALWLPAYLFCFAGGALVAHVTEGRRAGLVSLDRASSLLQDRWAVPLLALAVALVGTSALGGPAGFLPRTFEQTQVRVVSATLVAVVLLAAAVWSEPATPLRRFLGATWLNAVGRWSYGIYLWHVPVVVVLERDVTCPSGPLGLVVRLLVVLAITVPLGAATYAWVERPTLAWSRDRLPRGRATTPTASPSTATQPSTPSPTPHRSEDPAS